LKSQNAPWSRYLNTKSNPDPNPNWNTNSVFRCHLLLLAIFTFSHSRLLKPRYHLARHVSTRSTCRASRDERVEPCCSNMADSEQAIVLACTGLVVVMLLRTQILFVPSNETNEINVYSSKLVNFSYIMTLYKLHSKLSCESRLSRFSCRASRARRVEPCCLTSSTQPKMHRLSNVSSRIVSRRDEP